MCDTPQMMQANPQQVQQGPVSKVETLLRKVEKVSTLQPHQGDVAQAADEQAQRKADKPSFWHWLPFKSLHSRHVARLSKAERARTHTDVQRMDVKGRLQAIAQNFQQNANVQQDPKFLEILEKIEEYCTLDVTALSGEDSIKKEQGIYSLISNKLDEYVGQRGNIQSTDQVGRMAVKLRKFFNVQKDGALNDTIPSDRVITDDLRAPLLTKIVGKDVALEDFSSRGRMTEKDMKDVPLFSHEPSINDIRQGNLGDCFFLSALCSIVNQNPQAIKDCMKDNGDGTVCVRFYKEDIYAPDTVPDSQRFRPYYVQARKKIPIYKSGLFRKREDAFAGGAFWVQMMERAYAIAQSKLSRKDRFGNTYNERRRKYSNVKRQWSRLNGWWAKRRFLEETKKDASNLFMFDENGGFYTDYDKIPKGSCYADIAGGRPEEAMGHILGKRTGTVKIEPKGNRAKLYGFQKLQEIHASLHRTDPNTQTNGGNPNAPTAGASNKEALRESLFNILKSDPQTANRGWTDGDLPDPLLGALWDTIKRVLNGVQDILDNAQIRGVQQKKNAIRNKIDSDAGAAISQPVTENTPKAFLITRALHPLLLKMTEGIVESKQQKLAGGYSFHDEKVYEALKNHLAQGKIISASSREVQAAEKKTGRGRNGEVIGAGIAGLHAYTVLGVEEREIQMGGGKTAVCKFVKVRNPWGSGATRYDVRDGELRSTMSRSSKQGVCLIEFREFLDRFMDYSIMV